MTRYARVKREQRIQEANATPWSAFQKQASADDNNNNRDDAVVKSKKIPKKRVGKEAGEIVDNDSSNDADGDCLKTKISKLKAFEETPFTDDMKKVPSKSNEVRLTGANAVMSYKDLSKLTKSLFSMQSLDEVKKRVRQLWKDGQVEKSQAAKLIRKWRSQQWQEKNNKNREKLVSSISTMLDSTEEQTLDDFTQMVNEYVRAGKIRYEDAAQLIRKWKKRENRRIKRQLVKGSNAVCFYCRQMGHKFSECPEKDREMMGSGICFKCGSTEHTSSRCHRKNVRGYPYATCFVCKQQGHLSRECNKNANGIYPDGGSCNLCGSQQHLKKDCPLKKSVNESNQKKPMVAMISDVIGGDDDVLYGEDGIITNAAKKKCERKVVHI